MTVLSHPATLPGRQLLAQCEITRTRRGGPGGQHRNKVETAVVIVHRPTGTRAEAAEQRSQPKNQVVALFRLRVNLALEIRQDIPRQTGPSPLWMSRLHGGRLAINPAHEDFPALLAEALDWIAAHEFDLKAAAGDLKCTASQLTKFLKHESRALARVNARRSELGLTTLK